MASNSGPLVRAPRRAAPDWLLQLLTCLLLLGWTTGCASLPSHVERPPSHAFTTPEQTALGRLALERRTAAGTRAGSGFLLLDSVETAFTSRLALVEGAERSLDLQYYAIHADTSTAVLLERIRAAARRGVRVRILLDDFNSVGEDAQVLRLAFEPGVEIRLFNPLVGSRRSLLTRVLGSLPDVQRIQKRMHNKLFIADNAWGITGGRNLGDAYFGGDGESAFVDLDVMAAGAIVKPMSASFDRFWNDQLAYPVQALLSRKDLDRLREAGRASGAPGSGAASAQEAPEAAPAAAAKSAAAVADGRPSTVLPDGAPAAKAWAQRPAMDLRRAPLVWAPSTLLVDEPGKIGPGDDEAGAGDTVVDGLLQLMQQARSELLIISPYFVPGPQMMEVFRQARARGVAVRVLTNSLASNDAPAAHAGYRRYRRGLLRMGVELHEMRADSQSAALHGGRSHSGAGLGSAAGGSKSGATRASLHSKAVVIDRRLSVIGSMNLDLRSHKQNSEVALLIRSRKLADLAAGLIERSFAEGTYRVELDGEGGLAWRAPPGAAFGDATQEPEASLRLRGLVNLLAPFAPDEML
ncbi:phospholipase D family protein [Ramlibacter tataouinensis]|uniref:phospholipase D family protein n=1 Tax=Ramlibacter tataouinensis TaxID=94132 RepID=UPI0022F3F216|nr:phospholipase D family protein [Ramlibacter tataouinensis]WBY00418.1 phospholipase D family protein [Ramlibacter tataouinensis]